MEIKRNDPVKYVLMTGACKPVKRPSHLDFLPFVF